MSETACMDKGFFITGTDTGVGKTFVSACVTMLLSERGIDAVPAKPVQSGCVENEGNLVSQDLAFCVESAGVPMSPSELSLASTYRFKEPCSPHLAASMAGETIDIDRIVHDLGALAATREYLVVEGAGGVLVPLTEEITMLDLMKVLAIPVILVARPALGTINHSLLSIDVLKAAGLHVAGIVFNQCDDQQTGVIEQENFRIIPEMSGVPLLGVVPFSSSPSSAHLGIDL